MLKDTPSSYFTFFFISQEEIDEVCQKNVSILRDQRKQTDLKHQLRSFDREFHAERKEHCFILNVKTFLGLICKWEDVGADIRQGLKQHSELRNISEKIVIITGDLATLDSIISDDHDDQLEDDDDEVVDIMHQLFEVSLLFMHRSPPQKKHALATPMTRTWHSSDKVTRKALILP